MNKTNHTKKIGECPRFVTPDELERGKALLVEYERISDHSLAISHGALRRRWEETRNNYTKEPTNENYAALLSAAKAGDEALQYAHAKVRTTVLVVLKTFTQGQLVPFLMPLFERGLQLAQESLRRVERGEQARSKELIGRPVDLSQSPFIHSAKEPVCELESLISDLSSETLGLLRSPAPFVAALEKYSVS
jgi:hypothetical protein